jgi:ATP-dependent DNA helicase 2 subunit 1
MAQMTFKSEGADGISLLSSLISDINSKQVAKRSTFSHMPFEIGPGFKITVKGYTILKKQAPARTQWVYIGGEKTKLALPKTSRVFGEQLEVASKDDIKRAYKFGGDYVMFSKDDTKEVKNFGDPCIRIIGFKPQEMLPFWASMTKSTFIYPTEEDYVGSTRVFAALWKTLLKDKKMGLAWYIARATSVPVLVAILPSDEKLDDHGGQVLPQGLWLYQLPYADDIRHPPDMPAPISAPDNVVSEMRKVIQQLQLPKGEYDPFKYPNPSLQWHYKILQALALDEELPEESDKTKNDKTIPKYKQIE